MRPIVFYNLLKMPEPQMITNRLTLIAISFVAILNFVSCVNNEIMRNPREKAALEAIAQTTCFPKQIAFIKQDYDTEALNVRRSCLKMFQEEFDYKFRPLFKGIDYPEIKWFLKALIELDGEFVEPTDLSTLIERALFGAVAHARMRSNLAFPYTKNSIQINSEKLIFSWPKRVTIADDIKTLGNFVTTVQKINSIHSRLEIKDLVHAGIYGMYKSVGNPYTGSFPAFPEVDDAISLETGTIVLPKLGMSIGHINGAPIVTKIVGGFTAYQAGIKKNDQLLKIQETSLNLKTLEEIADLLEGQANVVTVKRRISSGFKEVKLILPAILQYNYFPPDETTRYHLLDSKIGYIRIGAFDKEPTSTLAGEDAKFNILDDALSFFKKNKTDGLVLDLRNNPGGYDLVAEKVASPFLRSGQVIFEDWSKYRPPKKTMSRPGLKTDYPLVVLINEKSASASEVVASALKHYGRGVLIGTNTFGKGTAWVTIPKPDLSGGIRVTTSKWLTPGRKSIEEIGIQPDITFENENLAKPNLSKYLGVFAKKRIAQNLAEKLLETAFKLLRPEIRQRLKSVHVQLGEEHLRTKNLSSAEQEFRLALKEDHQDADAIVGLGNVYRHYQAFEIADSYYSRAIQIAPQNPAGYFERGINALFYGTTKQAVRNFEKVIELNPFFPGVNYYLGMSLNSLGQWNQAKHHLMLATIFDTNVIGK